MRTNWIRGTSIVAGFAAISTAIAARADDPADTQFCANIAATDAHLVQLQKIGPETSVRQVQVTTGQIQADAKEMRKASSKMTSPAAEQFDSAVNELVQEVTYVRNSASLARARPRIHSAAQEAQGAGRQLAAEANCSETARH